MANSNPAHRRSTAVELLRLMAAYLAAVLVLQGVAAAMALGRGPLHSHRDVAGSVAALVFSHHEHQHRSGERHFHAGDDSVVALADGENIDALAFALTAALALLAWGASIQTRDRRRHVLRAAAPWAWRAGLPGFLFKPPRRG